MSKMISLEQPIQRTALALSNVFYLKGSDFQPCYGSVLVRPIDNDSRGTLTLLDYNDVHPGSVEAEMVIDCKGEYVAVPAFLDLAVAEGGRNVLTGKQGGDAIQGAMVNEARHRIPQNVLGSLNTSSASTSTSDSLTASISTSNTNTHAHDVEEDGREFILRSDAASRHNIYQAISNYLAIQSHNHQSISVPTLLRAVTLHPSRALKISPRLMEDGLPASFTMFPLHPTSRDADNDDLLQHTTPYNTHTAPTTFTPKQLRKDPSQVIQLMESILRSPLTYPPHAIFENGNPIYTVASTPLCTIPPLHFDFDSVPTVLECFQSGRPVIILDSPDRENEGDLIMAASDITEHWMSVILRYSSGVVCAPMTNEWADKLELPLMVEQKKNRDGMGTRFTVTCDLIKGTTTGISSHDRAATCRALADPSTLPSDLARPGHVFPLRAVDGGVLERQGHTETGVDLCKLTNKPPVAVICELNRQDGSMMRAGECIRLARRLGIAVGTVADLVHYLTSTA